MTVQLVLVSTPIGNLGDLSPRARDTLAASAIICCEDTRRTGKLLAHAGIRGPRLVVCNEFTEATCEAEVVTALADGHQVALVTDAGTPGISDPGMRLTRSVIDHGFAVSAVPGPAAFVTALVMSGLDATRFVFEGFLPRSGRERAQRLHDIAHEQRTIVLYEAPHRMLRTAADLGAVCGGQRRVALARELTKLHEQVWRGTLGDALAHLAEQPPRGEYVVVLEGAAEPGTPDDDALRAALTEAVARGLTRKDAVASVAALSGAPRRRVYDLALQLPR